LLLAPKGIGHYWKTHYTDKIYNFHGLYRWNAFDTALLIPYFVVMIILAFYGSIATSWCGCTSRTRRTPQME